MIYKRSELTECELTAMKIVWDAKEPITCQEIINELKNKYDLNYKDTTVYTFLKNLKEKGFVDSYRKGITLYVPLRSEEEYRSDQLKKMEKFWFSENFADFIVTLAEESGMNAADIDAIKKIMEKYKNN
jgi:predicted transcriptional regulator